MNEGWIKLNRSILKWGWYEDANTFRVFIDILLHANYEDSEYMGEIIHTGECVTGYAAISKRLNLSIQSVRTAFKHLHKSGEISTIKVTNKFSIVRVEKWGLYQGCDDNANRQANITLTGNQQATNRQLTPSKKLRREEVNNTYSYSLKGLDLDREIEFYEDV